MERSVTRDNILAFGSQGPDQSDSCIQDLDRNLWICYNPQVLKPNFYSEDLVETVKQYHQSGVSLESLDSTIKEFCEQSNFDVSSILYQGCKFCEVYMK